MTEGTRIFHSVNRWLPVTAGWIQDQIDLFDAMHQTVLADQRVGAPKESMGVVYKKEPLPLLRHFVKDFRKKTLSQSIDHQNILWSHFGNRGWKDLKVQCDKRIVRFYGYDLHRLPKNNPVWLDRYAMLFQKSDLVICEGPFMKKILLDLKCPENKISMLPIGVNASHPLKLRTLTKGLEILIAGAFKEKKGIVPALNACKRFIDSNPNLPITIHLVGDEINATENDRRYANEVRKAMAQELVKNRIVFHSVIDRTELIKLALNCQFALLPSQWAADGDCEGGYPITLLDLMSTGLPIISTRHCDIPFVIDETNGILCEEGNVEQLTTAMNDMCQHSALESKSKGAYNTIVSRFDWSVLKEQYHETILGT